MHELAFANAILKRRAVVLKVPLRPYSLGHELWLISRNNPLLTGGKVEPHHLIQAVLICFHSHAGILKMDSDWLLSLKVKILRRRIRRGNLALKIAEFKNYLAEGSSLPETREMPTQGPPSYPAGAPLIQRVIQFLILRFRVTEEEALNYPKAAALWHYCAFWESEGGLRIKCELDVKAETFISRMEELTGAGMAVDEAIKIVRAEEEACT